MLIVDKKRNKTGDVEEYESYINTVYECRGRTFPLGYKSERMRREINKHSFYSLLAIN